MPSTGLSPTQTPLDAQPNGSTPLNEPLVGPLALWVGIQTIAVGISAGRIPFASVEGFPYPAEKTATFLMLGTQIFCSTLLFPLLARNRVTAVSTILAACPFTILAQFLSAQIVDFTIVITALYVALWLTALAILNSSLRSLPAKMVAVAGVSAWVMGGAMLEYLHAEYGSQVITGSISALLRTPLIEAMSISEQAKNIPWALISIGVVAASIRTLAPRNH